MKSEKEPVVNSIKEKIEHLSWILECPEEALLDGIDERYLDNLASHLSHLCLRNLELSQQGGEI